MIICANFKANHTRKSTQKYLNELQSLQSKHQIMLFPPNTALMQNDFSHVSIGVQNFYPVQNGSFTGEIAKEQIDEFNIKCVLIGHSERRHILNENDELIKAKFDFAKKQNWEIIFCIGESLHVRKSGKDELFLYLQNQLNGIDLTYQNLIIAYEPVWAIGTGQVATKEDINEVLEFLKTLTKAPLLYGGSVNAKNVKETFSLPTCDGVLVGTASLEANKFKQIIQKAN